MNRIFLTTLLVLAVALTGNPAGAQSLSVKAPDTAVAASILHSQLDNPGGSYTAQNFEAAYDSYDAWGADDFTVPADTTWTIQGIGVMGTTLVGDAPDSFNVSFHVDDGGLPLDPPKGSLENLPYTLVDGVYRIMIGNLRVKGGLEGRHLWVSVQANMDFLDLGDQWFWTSQSVQSGSAGAWKNPGGGFLAGCTEWGALTDCLGVAEPDWSFIVVGSSAPTD